MFVAHVSWADFPMIAGSLLLGAIGGYTLLWLKTKQAANREMECVFSVYPSLAAVVGRQRKVRGWR